jgi:acyl-CoA synthetase (AMP-forming)/AMP-acid ligase II
MLQVGRLSNYLALAAGQYPDRVALTCGGRALGYRELSERAARIATGLREHGLSPGDVVMVVLDQTAEFVETLFGIWWAGGLAAVFPRMPGADRDDIPRLGAVARAASTWIISSAVLPMLEPAFAASPGPRRVFVVGDPGSNLPYATLADSEASSPAPHGAALVEYTTASNGFPRGVVFTEDQLIAYLAATKRAFPRFSHPKVLCPHPCGSPVALAALLASVRDAGTYVVPERADAANVLRSCRQQRLRACVLLRASIASSPSRAPIARSHIRLCAICAA